ITHLVSDSNTSIKKLTRESNIQTIDCLVHKIRGMKRKFYTLSLSEQIVGKTTSPQFKYIRSQLCETLANRLSLELRFMRNKHKGNINNFLRDVERLTHIIIPCLSGSRGMCKISSYCNGQNIKKQLPNKMYLKPTPTDSKLLQQCIDCRRHASI
ncbi:unnamed protein product, partial [Owenia fusiformis]